MTPDGRGSGPGPGGEPGPRDESGRRAPELPGPVCELCGAAMLDRHCKVVCLNCGYQRDCSDP